MRTAIYTRVSKDDDGTSSSPESQLQECRKYAQAQGWEVVAEYTSDRDTSAYRDVERKDFDEMLSKAADYDVVLAWKLDRLTRQGSRGFFKIVDALDAAGTKLALVTERIDTTDAMGEGVAGLIASMGKQESQNTSDRVSRALRQSAEAGNFPKGKQRVFGFTEVTKPHPKSPETVVHPHPTEAPVVAEVAARRLQGESWSALADNLNARDITSVAGNRWTQNSLRTYMLNPLIAGFRHHQKLTKYRGNWQPLISEDQHYALVAMTKDAAPRRNLKHEYLPVLFCKCGAAMATLISGRKRQYRCNSYAYTNTSKLDLSQHRDGSAHNYINYDAVNTFLAQIVEDHILETMGQTAVDGSELVADEQARQEATDTISTADARLQKLSQDFYSDALISEDEYRAARTALVTRRTEAQAVLDRNQEFRTFTDLMAAVADKAVTFDPVAATFRRVEVGPAVTGAGIADRLTVTLKTP